MAASIQELQPPRDNRGAIRFYQKHGFRITGSIPEYHREGLDAVALVKKIH